MGLLARLGPVYPNLDLSAFEGYLVRDTGLGAHVRVVLLCESPHCDEIGSDPRLPLVGQSGKSVARVLAELVLNGVPVDGTPIGELVSERRVGYKWLGLMNACQLPLQRDAYVDFPQQECKCAGRRPRDGSREEEPARPSTVSPCSSNTR